MLISLGSGLPRI